MFIREPEPWDSGAVEVIAEDYERLLSRAFFEAEARQPVAPPSLRSWVSNPVALAAAIRSTSRLPCSPSVRRRRGGFS